MCVLCDYVDSSNRTETKIVQKARNSRLDFAVYVCGLSAMSESIYCHRNECGKMERALCVNVM